MKKFLLVLAVLATFGVQAGYLRFKQIRIVQNAQTELYDFEIEVEGGGEGFSYQLERNGVVLDRVETNSRTATIAGIAKTENPDTLQLFITDKNGNGEKFESDITLNGTNDNFAGLFESQTVTYTHPTGGFENGEVECAAVGGPGSVLNYSLNGVQNPNCSNAPSCTFEAVEPGQATTVISFNAGSENPSVEITTPVINVDTLFGFFQIYFCS